MWFLTHLCRTEAKNSTAWITRSLPFELRPSRQCKGSWLPYLGLAHPLAAEESYVSCASSQHKLCSTVKIGCDRVKACLSAVQLLLSHGSYQKGHSTPGCCCLLHSLLESRLGGKVKPAAGAPACSWRSSLSCNRPKKVQIHFCKH